MNTELMNTIAAANDKAQYDACAKRLIGQKMILAHILVRTVDEFKGGEECRGLFISSAVEMGHCILGSPTT